MVELFLCTLADLPISFPKSCSEQLLCNKLVGGTCRQYQRSLKKSCMISFTSTQNIFSASYFVDYLNVEQNLNHTFDDLRYILYTKKNKKLRSLPPTSNMSRRDDLRPYYVVLNCSNLISAPDTNLNLVEFDWNSVDSVLMPNKCIVTLPKMYTVTFGCKKNGVEDVSNASLALHAQNFAIATEKNVVPKFTNRLSLSLHKIRKYKDFLLAKFSRIWTESKDVYGKICVRENLHICIFYSV